MNTTPTFTNKPADRIGSIAIVRLVTGTEIAATITNLTYGENRTHNGYQVKDAAGQEHVAPEECVKPADAAQCIRWLLATAVTSGVESGTHMAELRCNSEWDNHADFALYDNARITKAMEQAKGMMEAGKSGDFPLRYIALDCDPTTLFLNESDIELSELTEDNADDFTPDELSRLVIVDGVVYESDEDPSAFSDNTWVFDSLNLTVHGFSTVKFYGKHSGEELWFTTEIDDATQQQAAA